MSTAQDEAESGHYDSKEQEREDPKVQTAPDGTFFEPVQEDPGEGKDNDHSSSGTTTSFRKFKEHTSNLRTELSPTASPTLERPSSADGSLSIPDDTPSIQVPPLLFLVHVLAANSQ